MLTKPKILLIYTGGTIGMVKDFDSGALKAFNFSELLQNIPELKQLDCHIENRHVLMILLEHNRKPY